LKSMGDSEEENEADLGEGWRGGGGQRGVQGEGQRGVQGGGGEQREVQRGRETRTAEAGC